MTIRCKECGSDKVQIAMWVSPNLAAQIDDRFRIDAKALLDDYGSWNSAGTQWCESCDDHVMFTNDVDEGAAKMYRIFNSVAWAESGDELFWQLNEQGWVDRSVATVFTRAERNNLALPFDGMWVEVDDATE